MKLNTVLAVSLLVAVGVGFGSGCHHHHHSSHHGGGHPTYIPGGPGHHSTHTREVVVVKGPRGGKPAPPARRPPVAVHGKHPGKADPHRPGGFNHKPTSVGVARPAPTGKSVPERKPAPPPKK